MTNIPTLLPHDVLCGKRSEHEGNKYFRSLVKELKNEYVLAPKKQKPMYASFIVERIRSLDPPGRFLKYSRNTGLYDDIGDKEAITKTRQALREGAPDIEKQLKGSGAAKFGNKAFLPVVPVTPNSVQNQVDSMPALSSSNPEPLETELHDFLVDAMHVDTSVEDLQRDSYAHEYDNNPNTIYSQHDDKTRQSFYDARNKRSFYDAPFGQSVTPLAPSLEETKEETKEEFEVPNNRHQYLCSFRSDSVRKMSLSSMRSSVMSNLYKMSIISNTLDFDIDEADFKDDSEMCSDEENFETYQNGYDYQYSSKTSCQESFPHGIKNEITSIDMSDNMQIWDHQNECETLENPHHRGHTKMQQRSSWNQGNSIHEIETQSQIHHRRNSSFLVLDFVNAMLE